MKIESYAFENWHSPKGKIKKIYAGATGLEIGILGASLRHSENEGSRHSSRRQKLTTIGVS